MPVPRSSTMGRRVKSGGRSATWHRWTSTVTPRSGGCRCGLRPVRPVLAAAVDGFDANGFLDWGGGLVWIAGPSTQAAHASVEAAATAAGGTWMLMRAAEPLRAAVQVIPPEPEPMARITRRVKAALDPHAILNPGRMYAGL